MCEENKVDQFQLLGFTEEEKEKYKRNIDKAIINEEAKPFDKEQFLLQTKNALDVVVPTLQTLLKEGKFIS